MTVKRGTRREVDAADMDTPAVVESFTIPEAADALGKSLATFRRWLSNDLIPEPYLRDMQSGYKVYSRGELEVIAEALTQHAQAFSYYCEKHENVRHAIHQRMQAYRSQEI